MNFSSLFHIENSRLGSVWSQGHRAAFLPFAGLVVWAYLAGLNSYPLTERSEARYAGVAWEMLRSGDYLTPRYNGIKHLHKPPLFYWLTAGSMGILGESEEAARLPCALAALATLAVVGWWAKRPEMGCSHPWLVPACLSTSPFFWEMGRVAVTDMLVTFLVTVSLAVAWKVLSEGPDRISLVIFWAALGLNFLAKGPVGPLIVAMALLPTMLLAKVSWRVLAPGPGLVLAAAIGLPWYLWIVSQNPGLLSYLLKFQTADRVFTTVHERTGPPWFYLPVLLGGFLPWSVWLPGSIRRAVGLIRKGELSPDALLLAWIVGPTLFFSMMGSKLPTYVLPLFPALALLVSRQFAAMSPRARAYPLGALTLLSLACATLTRWSLSPKVLTYSHELATAAAWLAVVSLVGLVLWIRGGQEAVLIAPVVAMLGVVAIALPGLPKLRHNSALPIVESIRQHSQGPYEIGMWDGYLFGLPYYTRQNIIHIGDPRETQFEDNDDFRALLSPDLPTYLPTFQKGDKDRFLIVPLPLADSLASQLGETVVFRDARWALLYHRRGDTR